MLLTIARAFVCMATPGSQEWLCYVAFWKKVSPCCTTQAVHFRARALQVHVVTAALVRFHAYVKPQPNLCPCGIHLRYIHTWIVAWSSVTSGTDLSTRDVLTGWMSLSPKDTLTSNEVDWTAVVLTAMSSSSSSSSSFSSYSSSLSVSVCYI